MACECCAWFVEKGVYVTQTLGDREMFFEVFPARTIRDFEITSGIGGAFDKIEVSTQNGELGWVGDQCGLNP